MTSAVWPPPGRHITITCERCGRRQTLERRCVEPVDIHIVCHGCERTLLIEVRREDLEESRL
jgi:hypothetical protein